MTSQMSKDFEQLSAYIDNQLSAAEKAELEARLANEAELKATLNDLQRTVRVLRTLPVVKPPHNFTLTPAQVGVRRGPLFPVFRLAAALCSLLLVLAVARDFTTSSLSASATRDLTTQSSAVTPLALPNAAALLGTPTPESSLGTSVAGAPRPTSSASAEVDVTPFALLGPSGENDTPTPAEGQATAEATTKNLAPTETPADIAASVAALPPTATETELAPQTASAPPSTPAASGLRVAELVLAALALALAAAAWFTRRG